MSNLPMDQAVLIKVIRTTILRRGEGQDQFDPVRIVTQYWSTDGELLAEVDPYPRRQKEPTP